MIVPVTVGGRAVRVIVNKGCSITIMAETVVPKSELVQVKETVQMMDGSLVSVRFRAATTIECGGRRIDCNVQVVPEVIALRCEMLLGMDVIEKLGGVWVPGRGKAPRFGCTEHHVAVGVTGEPVTAQLEDVDFQPSSMANHGPWRGNGNLESHQRNTKGGSLH